MNNDPTYFTFENNIITMPNLDYSPEPGGIGKLFFRKMLSHGDAIAQIHSLTGEKDSYDAFLRRAIRTAIVMRSKGIQKGDIITICSHNNLNTYVPFVASLFLGAIPANIEPNQSQGEISYFLNLIKPKMIFISTGTIKLIEKVVFEIESNAEIVTFGESRKHTQFSEFLTVSPEENDFVPIEVQDLNETVLILFHFRQNKMPRGMYLNHFGILSQCHQFKELGFNFSVCRMSTSLHWFVSVFVYFLCVLNKGCQVIFPTSSHLPGWDLLLRHKVTFIIISPSQAAEFCIVAPPARVNFPDLSEILVVGNLVASTFLQILRTSLPTTRITMAYLVPALSGITMCFGSNPHDIRLAYRKVESCGKPLLGMSYKIVDLETNEVVGPSEMGELRIKSSDLIMNGLHNMDSSDVFDDDGFFKTGKIAYFDRNFCFYVLDAVDNILKYRTWYIPPGQLETVLLTHPAVKTAVVIGMPNRLDGDHPMGLVVLRSRYKGIIEAADLQEYADELILEDHHKLRGGVKIIKEMPKIPCYKVVRKELRSMVIKGVI